jgi:hypothetical protein
VSKRGAAQGVDDKWTYKPVIIKGKLMELSMARNRGQGT